MAATYTYKRKGKQITGTSTTAKVFKDSGIKNAKAKQTCLNKDTGHVYICTVGGNAKEAKWKYVRTDIIAKPDKGVSKLGAPVRTTVSGNNRCMKAEWKAPKVSKTDGKRAQGLEIDWFLGMAGTAPKCVKKTSDETLTSHQINLNNLKIGKTTYNRSSFYPENKDDPNKKKVLNYVTVQVKTRNTKGNCGSKLIAKATRNFKTPRAPSLSAFTFNENNGEVSITITTDAGTDYQERYDTRYKMTVYRSKTGKTVTPYNTKSTSTSITLTYDCSDYQQLEKEDYIMIYVEAHARGYAGPSKIVSKTFYVSYPKAATLSAPTVTGSESFDKCTVPTKTNHTTEHPVDFIKLEYLANCTYMTAAAIPGDASWTDAQIQDDAQCSALAMGVANLIPDAGKYSWLRAKSYHASENVLYTYSNYVRVVGLETPAPTAEDDDITIISATAGADGESAIVVLGWNADGTDDSTGTELTWSDEEDMWKSTKSPSKYNFEWSDGAIYELTEDTSIDTSKTYYTRTGSGTTEDPYVYTEVSSPRVADIGSYYEITYQDSATITIKDLDEATKYYIKARRYLEDDTTTYSEYSNTETVVTSAKPETVVASCASYVPTGGPLSVFWTFAGNGLQTEWQIVTSEQYVLTTDEEVPAFEVTDPTDDDIAKYYEKSGNTYTLTADVTVDTSKTYYLISKTYYTLSNAEYTEVVSPSDDDIANYYEFYASAVIDKGESSIGSVQISAERLASFAINNSITFTVQVSTGSGFVVSEEQTVIILDAPTLSLSASEQTLTAQPLSFNATVSSLCDLIVIVSAQGTMGQFPDGMRTQTSGDTVHSDVVRPVWTADGDTYTATIELPSGLDFWDTAKYTLTVTAVDRVTGLSSDKATSTITVAWAHQAPEPVIETYTLTTDTEVDDEKAYYALSDGIYTIVEPEGTEDPSSEGWYELTTTSYVTLTPIDSTDESGYHTKAVQIDLTPPSDAAETDVYDIYRLTGDGAQIIGEGFPLTYTAVDMYAPFADNLTLHYRIACRTVDGDIAWDDIEYIADADYIRFDWTGGFLEVPYNLTLGDSYKKDVEMRSHMDGGIDGYWNQNIERKGSISTDVIPIEQLDEVDKARELARYTGPVFVRTPDGTAYEADVQVSDLSVTSAPIRHIAFDANEVQLTGEFALPTPFTVEEEETE